MFARIALASAIAALAHGQSCPQPLSADGLGHTYLCDTKWVGDFSPFKGMEHGGPTPGSDLPWEGAPPGVVREENVKLPASEDEPLQLTVMDHGNGWEPEQLRDSKCNCSARRISTAMVATEQRFGYGFYQIKVRTHPDQFTTKKGAKRDIATPTPFHASFWLQGDRSEINVIEFVDDNVVNDGQSEYANSVLCFNPDDETGAQTVEQRADVDTQSFDKMGSSKYHTYGVEWRQDTVKFFLDGKLIRTASAACLVGDSMNVVIGHETNPDFGGYNDVENWKETDYAAKFNDATLDVLTFNYWHTRASVTVKDTSAKTCEELGWDNTKEGVCTRSKFTLTDEQAAAWADSPSVTGKDFCGHTPDKRSVSTAVCTAVGARVCSALEVSMQHDFSDSLCVLKRKKLFAPGDNAKYHTVDEPIEDSCIKRHGPSNLRQVFTFNMSEYDAVPAFDTMGNRAGTASCDITGEALAMTQCCADAKDYVPKTCADNTEVAAAYSAVKTVGTGTDAYDVCAREDFGVSRSSTFVGTPKAQCRVGNLAQAEAYCARTGGRLCTLDEAKIGSVERTKRGKTTTKVVGGAAVMTAANFMTKDGDAGTNVKSTVCGGSEKVHDAKTVWLAQTQANGDCVCKDAKTGVCNEAQAPSIKRRGYFTPYNFNKEFFKALYKCRSKGANANVVCCYDA